MTARSVPSQNRLIALVTGASFGIGAALARVLARHGHDLILVARTEAKLSQLKDELHTVFGISARTIVQDLSDPQAARLIFDQLRDAAIQVDILVNNAGFDVFGNFWETDLTREYQMIQVNLVSLTLLTKYLLPGMLARGYGRILNLGSTGSFIPSPLNAVYTATKAYVLSFSEAIGEELRGTGVKVTVLCPGATHSEFRRRANAENIRLVRFGLMDAEEVAEIGYRAMMAGKRVVVPGLINQLQRFGSAILPRRILMRLAKIMLSTPSERD